MTVSPEDGRGELAPDIVTSGETARDVFLMRAAAAVEVCDFDSLRGNCM